MRLIEFTVFSIFPGLFPGPLEASLSGEALKKNIWGLQLVNIRDFAIDLHKSVDDTPYGGGAGMVLRADILANAIDSTFPKDRPKLIYPSPRGAPLTQRKLKELSKLSKLAIICGRFEGIDQRLIEQYEVEELSIGDYVLSGGELAAMVIIDGIVRLLPEVVGDKQSLEEESFGTGEGGIFDNLLEYPHYTKPRFWRGREVPEVLLSGHHKNIALWRLEQAKKLTRQKRSDLLKD